jgi:hypothetical protein
MLYLHGRNRLFKDSKETALVSDFKDLQRGAIKGIHRISISEAAFSDEFTKFAARPQVRRERTPVPIKQPEESGVLNSQPGESVSFGGRGGSRCSTCNLTNGSELPQPRNLYRMSETEI